MAAAAEALCLDEERYTNDYPLVIPVAELPEDELVRRRAERFARAIGSQVVQHEVAGSEYLDRSRSHYPTLMHEIHAAAEGDELARAALAANAATEMTEITYKAGHRTQVTLEVDPDGYMVQHGQRLVDVYANALRLTPKGPMRRRVQAETVNGFRMMDVRRQRLLEDYAFVVFSRYPDNMTDEEAADAGFFADTKSCSVQTLREWDGKLVQETAFVAGVKERGADRHDTAALEGMGVEFGVSLGGKDATGMIATPLLIHRSLMPNGVVDLVRRYDRHAGGTFFGTAKPSEDYIGYLAKCRAREAQLEPRVQGIVADLIAEAATIRTPLDAFRRLHELSQQSMVDHAIGDTTIDPCVFGAEAAAHIEQARYWLARGDYSRFMQYRDSAQSTAQSSSCPAGISSKEVSTYGADSAEGGTNAAESGSSTPGGERKRMTCPFCGDRNQYGDPCSPNQYCRNCSARVVNGKVVSKGNGGRKADAPTKSAGVLIFRRKEISHRVARVALAP